MHQNWESLALAQVPDPAQLLVRLLARLVLVAVQSPPKQGRQHYFVPIGLHR
jgi:hypothetical protein